MGKEAKKQVDGVMPEYIPFCIAGYFVFVSAVLLFGDLGTAQAADSG